MIKTTIKIIGNLSTADELDEILKIAKVFLVEERMKDLSYPVQTKNLIEKTNPENIKKSDNSYKVSHKYLSKLTVRGFN